MSLDIIGRCWHCGRDLTRADYGRETACLGCSKPTRVCLNCRFFARGRPNDCVEPMAEPVAAKDRANFCPFFEPTRTPAGTTTPTQDLRRAADELFK